MPGANSIVLKPNLALGSMTQMLFVFGYDYDEDVQKWRDSYRKNEFRSELTLEEIVKLEHYTLDKQLKFVKLMKSLNDAGFEFEAQHNLVFYYDKIIATKGDTIIDVGTLI